MAPKALLAVLTYELDKSLSCGGGTRNWKCSKVSAYVGDVQLPAIMVQVSDCLKCCTAPQQVSGAQIGFQEPTERVKSQLQHSTG